MGGSYFIRDKHTNKNIGIFKPSDEEPCAPNNPKGLTGKIGDKGIKSGIHSGEQAIREFVAFLLDHDHLAGVPPTLLLELKFPRSELNFLTTTTSSTENGIVTGSFQLFAPSSAPIGNFSLSLFNTKDIQAIAALDMRLMNTDRHDGNILVQTDTDHNRTLVSYNLVPIDHGCCLPDNLNVVCDEWSWLNAPQLKSPLHPDIHKLITNLDIERDEALLRRLGIRPECIRTMSLASTFLKMCVEKKPEMSLFQIASLMCRPDFEVPSFLEKLNVKCKWITAVRLCTHMRKGDFETVLKSVFREEVKKFLS
jgi:hypothetical protein